MLTRKKTNQAYKLLWHAFLGVLLLTTVKVAAQSARQGVQVVTTTENIGKYAATDTNAIAQSIIYISRLQHSLPDSCIRLLQDLRIRSQKAGFRSGIGGALAEIGGTYLLKGNYRLAEQYILQSQTYPSLSTYTTGNAWNNLASIYAEQARYEDAIALYKKAMESADRNIAVSALNNFIVLLMKLGRHEESLFYIEKQKAYARKWKQDRAYASALCHEAYVYLEQKNFIKFDSIAKECLKFSGKLPDSTIFFIMTMNIGDSYVERGQPEQALACFERVAGKVPQLEPEYQAGYYQELGKALLSAKRYTAAIANLQRGIAMSRKIGQADILEPTLNLAEAYHRSGDYANAARMYKTHLALQDSLRDLKILNKVNEYEVRFRTAEKDKELLEKKLLILKQENLLKNKNAQLAIILSVTALLTIIGIGMYRSAKNIRLLQAKALEIEKQQNRIRQLNATITGEERERKRLGGELHDGIGSMLSALNMNIAALKWKNRHLPEMNELDNIVKLVQDVAVEVRKSAHNLTPDYLLHDGLLQALQSLAAQTKTREFGLTVSGYGNIEKLPASFTLIIYRIIQELINNILKHAHAQTADLQIRRHNNQLSITLEDDGTGFDTRRPADGIGLKQIAARVEALNGHLSIDSVPGNGTIVYMEFDLNNLNTAE